MKTVIVGIIAATQATLELWFAVSTSLVIVAVWVLLAAQKFRLEKGESEVSSSGSPP